jgi:hypothetical protein
MDIQRLSVDGQGMTAVPRRWTWDHCHHHQSTWREKPRQSPPHPSSCCHCCPSPPSWPQWHGQQTKQARLPQICPTMHWMLLDALVRTPPPPDDVVLSPCGVVINGPAPAVAAGPPPPSLVFVVVNGGNTPTNASEPRFCQHQGIVVPSPRTHFHLPHLAALNCGQ